MRVVVPLVALAAILGGCVNPLDFGPGGPEESQDPPPAEPGPADPPTPNATGWPTAGSFVRYSILADGAGPVAGEDEGSVTLRYTGTGWTAVCESRGNSITRDVPAPAAPTAVEAGKLIEVTDPGSCGTATFTLLVVEKEEVDLALEGGPVKLQAWTGATPPTNEPVSATMAWDPSTGLILTWNKMSGRGAVVGKLADTDAPLG